MAKYFKKLPSGYTNSYFFEFNNGFCTFRRLASSPDSEAHTIQIYEYSEDLKSRVLEDFFGSCETGLPVMSDLTLEVNPGRSLGVNKLKSLSKKYFSIPKKYRSFYPKVIVKEAKELANSESKKQSIKRKKESEATQSRKVKRKVGRPKLLPPIGHGIQSITSFFRPV